MASCTKQERELLDALKKASVVTQSSYKNEEGKLKVYRMRLFSRNERHTLRHALVPEGEALAVDGGSGMMDELQMINFEAHGMGIDEIVRQF